MKAISFLEDYNSKFVKIFNHWKKCKEKNYIKEHQHLHNDLYIALTQEFIKTCNDYYIKVSQPFSFEKVVELFEGFEIFNQHGRVRLILKSEDIAFEIDEDSRFVTVINFNNFYRKTQFFLWKRYVNDIIPKTIDEFITLCNNLNIELQWRNQEI